MVPPYVGGGLNIHSGCKYGCKCKCVFSFTYPFTGFSRVPDMMVSMEKRITNSRYALMDGKTRIGTLQWRIDKEFPKGVWQAKDNQGRVVYSSTNGCNMKEVKRKVSLSNGENRKK